LKVRNREVGMVKVKISRSGVVSYRDGKVRRAIAHGEYEAVQLSNGDWRLSKADRAGSGNLGSGISGVSA